MFSAGFEPATTTIKQPQTYTLDRTATEIGDLPISFSKNTRQTESQKRKAPSDVIFTAALCEGPT
jgi:hypothetical protein